MSLPCDYEYQTFRYMQFCLFACGGMCWEHTKPKRSFMSQSVLILGASGRFGYHCAQAFAAAGWQVTRFDRAQDDVRQAVQAADVVVNGWNPPDYTYWAREMLPLHQRVIDAAREADTTVIVPGNVYVFGAQTPAPWSEQRPHAARNPLGQLRVQMEAAYRRAGVRTILLRAGDFLDTRASGNWFDMAMVAKLAKGRFTYPGSPDAPHAWAYLPDMARAAVMLAERRGTLPIYTDVPFPGFTLTGAQIGAELEAITGRPVRVGGMPWAVLRVAQYVMPSFKGLCEMRYLWNTPHSLSAEQFNRLLPGFQPTPIRQALRAATAHTGAVSLGGQIDPDQAMPVQG